MNEVVLLIINLRHLDSDLIRKRFSNSLSTTDVSRKHDLNLDSHNSLREVNVSDGMIDVVVLWLTGGDQITLLVLLDLSSLLSEFSSKDNLTSFDLLNLHDVSDDEHSSRSGWGLLHQFGLKKFNLSTS